MEIYEGNTVRAFHPRMFGVVVYGTVVKTPKPNSNRVVVDFGPIHGGKFAVPRAHVVSVES